MATLARQFPPAVEADLAPSDRELLRTLRRRHLAEAARLEAQLRAELKPLAPPAGASEAQPIGSWQAGADALVASAQTLDGTLNRLLAGSYAQSEAEGLTRTAGSDLQHLRAALQAQREDAR
jgi:hypothetical protein